MQVDNNYNNYNNYKVNFGARRIMSAEKIVDGLSEKFEVYKLDYTDIPFAEKLAIYMKNQKLKLNDVQKKLFYKLREFVTHQEHFDVKKATGTQNDLYIGIKNDEEISGYMLLKNSKFGQNHNRKYEIEEICPNTKDKITEDTFRYTFFADKGLNNHFRFTLRTRFYKNKDFLIGREYKNKAKAIIRKEYPDYKFQISPIKNYTNLEDKLKIAQL